VAYDRIYKIVRVGGFTKSFELAKPGLIFCFLNKKTGSLCIVNDVVLFNIFLLQIFSNFKILNFKRPR
jgi:hypothetical protein